MRSHVLHLTPLSNEEFIQFFTQLLRAVDTGAAPLPAALESAKLSAERILADIKALFRRDGAPRLTAKVVAADGLRDDLVLGLQELCEGHCYNPDEQLRTLAGLLDHRLEVYGPRIHKQNYQKESAIISALVRDLREEPEYAEAVAALNLGSWIDALDAANDAFDRICLERSNYEAGNELPYSMISKREEMKNAYENLLHKLDGFYHTAEGAEPWNRIIRIVEVLTEEYREIVGERKGRKELTNMGEIVLGS
jgi:hypothetical protein